MLETPRMGLPYPERPDTVDVPRDIHALALGVESHSHICMLRRTTPQAINTPGVTSGATITYPEVVYDPDSMYISSGVRAGHVVLPFPGIWQLSAWANFEDEVSHLGVETFDHKYLVLAGEVPPFTTPPTPVGITLAHGKGGSASGEGFSSGLPIESTSIWRTTVADEEAYTIGLRISGASDVTIHVTSATFSVSCLRNLS